MDNHKYFEIGDLFIKNLSLPEYISELHPLVEGYPGSGYFYGDMCQIEFIYRVRGFKIDPDKRKVVWPDLAYTVIGTEEDVNVGILQANGFFTNGIKFLSKELIYQHPELLAFIKDNPLIQLEILEQELKWSKYLKEH